MPDRCDLLRGGKRTRCRAARRGSGHSEQDAAPDISEQRLRRHLSGIRTTHWLPVQLQLRRINGARSGKSGMAPRPASGSAGTCWFGLRTGWYGDALPCNLRLSLLGAEPEFCRHHRCTPFLQLEGQCGTAFGILP